MARLRSINVGTRVGMALIVGLAGAAVSVLPVHAAATFDVGGNGSFETSWTYADTADWDEFNDIVATVNGGAISTTGWTAVASPVVPPNTDVLTFGYYKNGTYGRMFLGALNNNSSFPRFTYVVDSNKVNALTNGATASDAFTFTLTSDSSTATFTVNVTGASDAPYVSNVIRDITDGLAATEGGTSVRLPTGASGAGKTAYGFSGSSTTPGGEKVEKAFDGLASTKYLNFGGAGSDVLIDTGEQFVATGVTLVTGNDEPGRDPKTLELWGSNSAFTDASNMTSWVSGATQIGATATLSPPTDRNSTYPKAALANPNRLAFRYYRLLFPTVRSGGMMQVSEVRIEGNKKASEATYTQGGGAVIIMGDTVVFGENPATAVVSISNGVAGDVLSCGACPVNGYTATWDSGTKSLTITKSSAPYSPTDLTTALQSITYNNGSFTGSRNAPGVGLAVTDQNGLTSSSLSIGIGMGQNRTVSLGVSGGSVPSSITYGGTVTLTSTASNGGGTVTYEVVSGNCTLSGAVLTMGTNTCKVRSTTEFDGTYAKTVSDTVTFASTAKSITVAASSHSVTQGDAVPTVTPVASGLVTGDTSAVVTGLTCSTTYTRSSPVGTYPTSCTGTPSATGYTVTGAVANGTVTVTAATTTTSVASSGTTPGSGSAAAPGGSSGGAGTGSSPVTTVASRSGAAAGGSGASVPVATTTSTSTTTTVPALASLEVPDTPDGGAGILVGGKTLSVDVSREDNEILVTAGPMSARIWAVGEDNEKVALDRNGHLRVLQGGRINTEVLGFDPGSAVETRLYSEPVLLGEGTVSTNGTFAETYRIPQNTPDGYHKVVLAGEADGETVTLALSILIGEESGGLNVIVIVVLLGLAIMVALLIPVAVRRRRDDEEQQTA